MSDQLKYLPGPSNRDSRGRFVKRDSKGQVMKGSAGLNPSGKGGGRPYSSAGAVKELSEATQEAIDTLKAGLRSHNEWVALTSAKTIIERTVQPERAEPDTLWLQYLEPDELATLNGLVEAAKARMPEHLGPQHEATVIDVEPSLSADPPEMAGPTQVAPEIRPTPPQIEAESQPHAAPEADEWEEFEP